MAKMKGTENQILVVKAVMFKPSIIFKNTLLYTWSDLSLRLVAASCRLVCTNL